MNKFLNAFLVLFIILLSGFLRFYNLDKVPASLNWDEIAAGYNSFTIANWGADEYGNIFPIVFKSFGDDKHPVHIYLTAIAVKLFGLSDYVVRSSSAFIGVVGVISFYFLILELTKSKLNSFLASFFMAISSYHIHFSRGLWENNFALTFFILGLTLFFVGIRKGNYLLALSYFSFGLSFFSYHSAKLVVPPVVLLLTIINFKEIFKNKILLSWIVVIGLFFGSLILIEPKILGFARANQTKFSDEQVVNAGGKFNLIFSNYKNYFDYNYLFLKGDQTPRGSVKVFGQFYKIDAVLIVAGIIALTLAIKKRWKEVLVVLLVLLLAPIPGAVSSVETNATRTMFLVFPILYLSSVGATTLVNLTKNKIVQTTALLLIVGLVSFEFYKFYDYYLNEYPKKEAIEWQYGMKQVVEYTKKDEDFTKLYMDKIRQQPYIFFLYYLQTPLPELLRTVKYDETESKSYNTVLSFDKYQFGGWNIIESYPNKGVLYAITPSYYSGLRHIDRFGVNKLIKYPNKTDAFYIVEGYE